MPLQLIQRFAVGGPPSFPTICRSAEDDSSRRTQASKKVVLREYESITLLGKYFFANQLFPAARLRGVLKRRDNVEFGKRTFYNDKFLRRVLANTIRAGTFAIKNLFFAAGSGRVSQRFKNQLTKRGQQGGGGLVNLMRSASSGAGV